MKKKKTVKKLYISSNTLDSNLIIKEDYLIPLQNEIIRSPMIMIETDEKP